jgi:hypothetical protein
MAAAASASHVELVGIGSWTAAVATTTLAVMAASRFSETRWNFPADFARLR